MFRFLRNILRRVAASGDLFPSCCSSSSNYGLFNMNYDVVVVAVVVTSSTRTRMSINLRCCFVRKTYKSIHLISSAFLRLPLSSWHWMCPKTSQELFSSIKAFRSSSTYRYSSVFNAHCRRVSNTYVFILALNASQISTQIAQCNGSRFEQLDDNDDGSIKSEICTT